MSDVLNGGLSGIQGNNQLVNVGGNNSGPIINGPAHFGPGNESVKYQLTPRGRYSNLWELAMPGLIKVGLAVLLGLVQWLNGTALLSAFGMHPVLATMVMIGLAIFLGMYGVNQLTVPLGLIERESIRRMGHYYERQADGSIEEAWVSAKCPVHGCAGTVSLQRPVQNQEGVECAGICSDHGHHAFEFNEESGEGTRLSLHPVRDDQRPR